MSEREMTLQEWIDRLPKPHSARDEFIRLKAENEEYRMRISYSGNDPYHEGRLRLRGRSSELQADLHQAKAGRHEEKKRTKELQAERDRAIAEAAAMKKSLVITQGYLHAKLCTREECVPTCAEADVALSSNTGQALLDRVRALEGVAETGMRWLENKRPRSFTKAQHLANPTVNCITEAESSLALAISHLDALEGKGTG